MFLFASAGARAAYLTVGGIVGTLAVDAEGTSLGPVRACGPPDARERGNALLSVTGPGAVWW